VLLLARDDEPHLAPVVAEWLDQLTKLGRPHELVVVDDGSSDKTRAVAQGIEATNPAVSVVGHDKPRGIGAALRTGLTAARHPLLFYTTADRQYRPADLPLLLAEIDKVHLVSGFRVSQQAPLTARFLRGLWHFTLRVIFDLAPEPAPGWLGWRESLYRFGARVVFGVRSRDVDCVFRLCRRHIFERIPLQSDGSFANVEVLAKANFLGCLLGQEVPVAHQPKEGPGDWVGGVYRPMIREGYRVFARPDFGPPVVPTSPAPAPPAVEERLPATPI
jgi:glycosyltransferase involved in cell wall biosynthesis